MERMKAKLAILGAAMLLVTGGVRADDPKDAKKEVAELWPIEAMMKQAAENISRRYNLNGQQREYTHKMLTEEVTKFLDEHEDIWPLIRDLARYQIQGDRPEGEIGKQIGTRAMPMILEVREAILSANERWREILTDEQKKMHDWDLRDMEKTFAQMETNFSAMAQGVPVDQPVFPPGPNSSDQSRPVRPPTPNEDFRVDPPREQATWHQENAWDAYVESFISRYKLDEAQSEAALSILRECKQRAATYRQSKQNDFREAESRMEEARRTANPQVKQAKVRVWTDIIKRLNKPVLDLFQELKDRLDRIPTAAQKERVAVPGARRTVRPRPEKPAATPAPKPGEADAAPANEPPKAAEDASAGKPNSTESAKTGAKAPDDDSTKKPDESKKDDTGDK